MAPDASCAHSSCAFAPSRDTAWYLFMVDSKLLRRVRAMLIGSFARKTTRRMLTSILVAWHEFAVHKTVETRSRSQLRASLKAQEALTAAAESALDEYAKVLIDAERSLESEARTQFTLQRQAEEARTELTSLRLKCHTAQQECLRLRTLVRHYELRYPKAFPATALSPQTSPTSRRPPPAAGREAADAEQEWSSEDQRWQSVESADGTSGADEHAPPPPPPMIVTRDEASRLSRLHSAASSILTTERYLPPDKGGTSADQELRRVRALLGFVLSGALPEGASVDMLDINDEAQLRLRVRAASSEAKVYSDDLETLRGLSVPAHLDGGAAGGAADGVAGGGSAPPPLLPPAKFGGANSITASELHSVPSISVGGEAGAETVARRVRERREALHGQMRQRVNLYAPESVVVETVEEAAAAAEAAMDGAGILSQALMGI